MGTLSSYMMMNWLMAAVQLARGRGPPSGQIEQGQVEQLPGRLVDGEGASGLDDLAAASGSWIRWRWWCR